MNEVTELISNLGVPIAVMVYMFWKEKNLDEKLIEAIDKLSDKIDKLIDKEN